MNAAEFHQQELEHQQWLEELEKCDEELKTNHGLIINQIRYLRDFIPTGYKKRRLSTGCLTCSVTLRISTEK